MSYKGYKFSEESRKKMSESAKHKPPMSLEQRKKISEQKYPFEWGEELKDLIRKRDNYICQECGIHQDELSDKWHKKLDVHHIDYKKDNCNPDNLISLCRSCHVQTNFDREYWLDYFINKNYE